MRSPRKSGLRSRRKKSVRSVLIVTPLALNEGLRRDDIAEVDAELQRVVPGEPGRVVDDLVVVLDSGLREVSVGPDVEAKISCNPIFGNASRPG